MRTLPPDPVPPFERFYLAHRDEVLRYLRKLLVRGKLLEIGHGQRGYHELVFTLNT